MQIIPLNEYGHRLKLRSEILTNTQLHQQVQQLTRCIRSPGPLAWTLQVDQRYLNTVQDLFQLAPPVSAPVQPTLEELWRLKRCLSTVPWTEDRYKGAWLSPAVAMENIHWNDHAQVIAEADLPYATHATYVTCPQSSDFFAVSPLISKTAARIIWQVFTYLLEQNIVGANKDRLV